MKKTLLLVIVFAISYQFINAQTNTPPLPNGETKIGEHFHAGAGNEVWTDAANLYFNYRGNAAATYFWNKNGSTGSSVLSILSNGNVGIGTTQPAFPLDITKNNTNALLHLGRYNSSSGLFLYSEASSTHYNWRISTQTAVDGGFEIARSASTGGTDWQVPSLVIKNGNVGIGTSSPIKSLQIQKNVPNGVGASLMLQNENYSTNNGAETEIILNHLTINENPYRYAKIHTVGADLYGTVDRLSFGIAESTSNYADILTLKSTGNVGIGTTNPGNYKLAVEGTIGAREVKVTTVAWADFVFHPTYKLRTLGEVEQFIKTNNHLPEIPSEKEVTENGISIGEMNSKLLQKVEELTLYLIEQQKQISQMKEQNDKLTVEIEKLKTKLQ